MAKNVSRIHSKKDDLIYNILPTGQFPTVVFGRVIKATSKPGMQYYFSDGRVKYKVEGKGYGGGWDYILPFIDPDNTGKAGNPRQIPCIFTVPDDFDFSKMSNMDYVIANSRTAKNLNANTMSSNFLIRNGKIICVKELEIKERYSLDDEGLLDGKKYFKYKMLIKNSSKRIDNWDVSRYRFTTKNKVKHTIHNQFEIIPLLKRNRKKIYKSTNRYPAFRERRGFTTKLWTLVVLGNVTNKIQNN